MNKNQWPSEKDLSVQEVFADLTLMSVAKLIMFAISCHLKKSQVHTTTGVWHVCEVASEKWLLHLLAQKSFNPLIPNLSISNSVWQQKYIHPIEAGSVKKAVSITWICPS